MATRTLRSAPHILPLYARATAPLLPGASRLPFVAGGGNELPDLELELEGVRIDRDRLAAYAHVCGFSLRDALPATFPHVLAFPLHMALMTDGKFPFGAIGLVHLSNRVVQHRPIDSSETLQLRVRLTPLRAHRSGRTFTIVSEARVEGELVWEDHSAMLRRGKGEETGGAREQQPTPPQSAVWDLPGDLGRRYAGVSGDRNPIHMHALSAKLFGFPRAIAHGMWTKARCLAALEHELPEAFSVAVDFRKPILLPGQVAFGAEPLPGGEESAQGGEESAQGGGEGMRFAVWGRGGAVRHLDGLLGRPGGAG
jgi:acyl dehydratase